MTEQDDDAKFIEEYENNLRPYTMDEINQIEKDILTERTQSTPEQDDVQNTVSTLMNEIISETENESNGMKTGLFFLISALGGIGVGVALAFIL